MCIRDSYSVVQNVDASTSGFIDSLFNIGKVTVRTAGADNELVFDRVWDPRRVGRSPAASVHRAARPPAPTRGAGDAA